MLSFFENTHQYSAFTLVNPQTGTPAPDLDDDYFRIFQKELASEVGVSSAVLDKSKHDQLFTALRILLISRAHLFADIKSDDLQLWLKDQETLALAELITMPIIGNCYGLIWGKGNVLGGVLATATAVAVSLMFSQTFGTTPLVYWPTVPTPSGVTAGADIVATCVDLTATGTSLYLYNASNADK